jgi:hypothetical protein
MKFFHAKPAKSSKTKVQRCKHSQSGLQARHQKHHSRQFGAFRTGPVAKTVEKTSFQSQIFFSRKDAIIEPKIGFLRAITLTNSRVKKRGRAPPLGFLFSILRRQARFRLFSRDVAVEVGRERNGALSAGCAPGILPFAFSRLSRPDQCAREPTDSRTLGDALFLRSGIVVPLPSARTCNFLKYVLSE